MGLDFRNTNTLWASVLFETWYRLGLRLALISPGSRSAPLTVACAQHPGIATLPLLDERSAAFFALGHAKATGCPVALICTSGTAAANFYPAVIEASLSQVPLLILSADRPPELHHCRAGQTIDQGKLYGHYPNWQAELARPEASPEGLAYLRQLAIQAWGRSLQPQPGVVHLNVPLGEPLAPLPEAAVLAGAAAVDLEAFFATTRPLASPRRSLPWPEAWQPEQRGLIIAGIAQPSQPDRYCAAVAQLAAGLGWPVLAEALSPLRHQAQRNPYLVSTYDLILRNPSLAKALRPEVVIQLGELPTSKTLRAWLAAHPVPRWVVAPGPESRDPLQGLAIPWPVAVTDLQPREPLPAEGSGEYLAQWLAIAREAHHRLEAELATQAELREGSVAWLLPQLLPPATPVLVANSSPVRDVEYFWPLNSRGLRPWVNRGANGIDGTLSTALGLAQGGPPTVLLTGDLALLHDTNGFLAAGRLAGSLTIVLLNNQGGGIFEGLAIAAFDPPFEEYFATPQAVDFQRLCATYGVEYQRLRDQSSLALALQELPPQGVRLLEIRTNRRAEAHWRQALFERLAAQLPQL